MRSTVRTVSEIVVEVDGNSSAVAGGGNKVHERQVDENLAPFGANPRDDAVREDDEEGPDHGEGAGHAHHHSQRSGDVGALVVVVGSGSESQRTEGEQHGGWGGVGGLVSTADSENGRKDTAQPPQGMCSGTSLTPVVPIGPVHAASPRGVARD